MVMNKKYKKDMVDNKMKTEKLTNKELIAKYKDYPKGYCKKCKGWGYLFLGIKNNKNIVKKCPECKGKGDIKC